jgi:hypothetical protein
MVSRRKPSLERAESAFGLLVRFVGQLVQLIDALRKVL